jgi:hypothetical protein
MAGRNSRICAVYVLAWLLIAAAFAGMLGQQWRRYYSLSTHGMVGEARITGKEPQNHRAVAYAFEVDGQSFDGFGRAGFGNPEFDALGVGDRALVYYLPDHPETSCLGDAHFLLRNESTFLFLVITLFPTFILLAWRWQRRRLW